MGDCHNLSIKQIGAPSDTRKPVSCSSSHTTETVAVMDAPSATQKGSLEARAYAVGEACGDGFKKLVGGTSKTRAKTLYSLAWFGPTKAQRAKGAHWMRCDVTLTTEVHAYPIKGKTPLLDDGPTDAELVCGHADLDRGTFGSVPCAAKHQFVPHRFVAADPGTAFADAQKKAKKTCLPDGALYSWSHAEQWGMGDRWYICWITVAEESRDEVAT